MSIFYTTTVKFKLIIIVPCKSNFTNKILLGKIPNNNEYKTIGLYDHNADSYNQAKSSFESGKDIVAIVHATGTGKSYNALQLAYDNKDKKIVYVVPSHRIIEHINKIYFGGCK